MADKNGTDEMELRASSARMRWQSALAFPALPFHAPSRGAQAYPRQPARKVLRAAEELGYQVNDLARGLLANRSQLIGMIASDAETPFARSRLLPSPAC